ncbi:MAG: TrmB family transcriptional regulator [Crenarchaeota archaeon]|nr:TrmB family transcriptional regulator [Thermoproteota archaeon]NPA99874.1 TrmB family transcriptional regulator [Thermoproteota archaeon]
MEGLKSKIYEFLVRNRGKVFTVEEIAKAVNEERISVVKAQLTRLVKEGKVIKVDIDKYKAV